MATKPTSAPGVPGFVVVALGLLGLLSIANLGLSLSLWQAQPVQVKNDDPDNPLAKNLAAEEVLRNELKGLTMQIDRMKDANRKLSDEISMLKGKIEGVTSAVSRVETVANQNVAPH